MKKHLIGIAVLLIVLKILFILFIPVPLGFSDSLTHIEGAKVFFANPGFSSAISTQKYIIFPILISPILFFKDMNIVYFLILVLNAIVSSLIIFPAYKLAKEFLKERESILFAMVIAVLPAIFISSFYVMSEALFYLIAMTSIYILFKAFTEKKRKWDLLAGIFIGITLLIKTTGLIILPVAFFLLLQAIRKKQWAIVKNKIFLGISGFLILLPFLIAKAQRNGFTFVGILGYTNEINNITHATNISAKVLWAFFYTDYVILLSIIICSFIFISALIKYKQKNEKEQIFLQLTFWFIIGTILIAANNGSYFSNIEDTRIIGRYVETSLGLLILTSLIFINDWKSKWNTQKTILFLFVTITTPFILTKSLLPLNNAGLAHIGVIQIIFQYFNIPIVLLTILISILTFLLLKIKSIKQKKLLYFLFLYFLLISVLSTGMIMYDSNRNWASLEEVELGQWVNANIEKDATFLIDMDDMPKIDYKDKPSKVFETKDIPIYVIAYWIYGEYTITNVSEAEEYDYIISTQNLKYEIIKEGETIKIYKVNTL